MNVSAAGKPTQQSRFPRNFLPRGDVDSIRETRVPVRLLRPFFPEAAR
jgi:hypothetical protein